MSSCRYRCRSRLLLNWPWLTWRAPRVWRPLPASLAGGAGARPAHPISGHERTAFAAMHVCVMRVLTRTSGIRFRKLDARFHKLCASSIRADAPGRQNHYLAAHSARLIGHLGAAAAAAMRVFGKMRKGTAMENKDIRAALDRHWAASDANNFDEEHQIYREDAVLEYPQSGERIRGRRNIQSSRFAQPNKKRFTVRRILGIADLWVTEFVLTYDGQPSYSVSIMEFNDGKVARETQYFGDPFEPGPSRAQWVEPMR